MSNLKVVITGLLLRARSPLEAMKLAIFIALSLIDEIKILIQP